VSESSILRDRKLALTAMRQLARSAAANTSRVIPQFGSRNITKLLIAPQDIRTSDPTIASEIHAGEFKLAGKLMETHGASPFALQSPSQAFEQSLQSFEWLRHFRAADTPAASDYARGLVANWMDNKVLKSSSISRRVDVTARRLISWLAQSPFLLNGVDADFYKSFIQSLISDADRLKKMRRSLPSNETLLLSQIALMHFAVSASESDAKIKQEAMQLCNLLDEQILSDGGHVSRSPAVTLNLLLDLLPLKLAFLWRRIQTPQPIISAIDRMMPMLRMMRHSDGSVALFNGMSLTRADILAAVLAQDDTKSPAILNAPYSGYQRVQHGKSILIVDAGAPPQPPLAHLVHAAPAAFEFSSEGGRLIVNCGSPPSHRPEMKAIARKTAAHSTLIYDETDIGQFVSSAAMNAMVGDQYFAGAKSVKTARATTDEGSILTVQHDGYAKSFGIQHERRLALSSDGLILEGEDILSPIKQAQNALYKLRFHLHPQVKAAPAADNRSIILNMPNGANWQFTATAGTIAIEDSIFLASPDGFRRCAQIVVSANFPQTPVISWSFMKF
jgi:uncharacterized heparinase superfamily protein